jgi:NTE family protein
MNNSARKERSALVLQGGGALGAYQAGVYEALVDAGEQPGWLAGISIGAINAAIIAGNKTGDRLPRLREFWNEISSGITLEPIFHEGLFRNIYGGLAIASAATTGVSGFFKPRLPFAGWWRRANTQTASLFNTAPLKETLLEMVDFDRINKSTDRFSVGAVDVQTGNFVYFDNRTTTIGPEHILASCAVPVLFPPVPIDGAFFWDGGLVSNTPLQHVLDNRHDDEDLTIFQVDLFPATGELPRSLLEAAERAEDIRGSSRTRLNTDVNRELIKMQNAARRLSKKLPENLRNDPDVQILTEKSKQGRVAILHLINRSEPSRAVSRVYEFSRSTIDTYWQTGYEDGSRSLVDKCWKSRKTSRHEIATYDFCG